MKDNARSARLLVLLLAFVGCSGAASPPLSSRAEVDDETEGGAPTGPDDETPASVAPESPMDAGGDTAAPLVDRLESLDDAEWLPPVQLVAEAGAPFPLSSKLSVADLGMPDAAQIVGAYFSTDTTLVVAAQPPSGGIRVVELGVNGGRARRIVTIPGVNCGDCAFSGSSELAAFVNTNRGGNGMLWLIHTGLQRTRSSASDEFFQQRVERQEPGVEVVGRRIYLHGGRVLDEFGADVDQLKVSIQVIDEQGLASMLPEGVHLAAHGHELQLVAPNPCGVTRNIHRSRETYAFFCELQKLIVSRDFPKSFQRFQFPTPLHSVGMFSPKAMFAFGEDGRFYAIDLDRNETRHFQLKELGIPAFKRFVVNPNWTTYAVIGKNELALGETQAVLNG